MLSQFFALLTKRGLQSAGYQGFEVGKQDSERRGSGGQE